MNPKDFSALIAFTKTRFPVLEPYFYVVPPTLVTDEQWTKLTQSSHSPTACVTGQGMYFAASFLGSLPRPKQIGLILHEVLHLVRQDLSQPWIDRTIPLSAFRSLANVAQDHCIERIIADMAGLTDPNTPVAHRMFEPNYPEEKWNAYPANTPWRVIYSALKKGAEKRGGDGEGESGDGDGEDGDDQGVDAPSPDSLESLRPLLERASREAKQVAARMVGLQRGDGSDLLLTPEAPSIPWRQVLRASLIAVPSKVRRTWVTVNRRYFALTGQYRSGRTGHEDALRDVSLYVDTSGSMHSTLGRVAGDILNLLATLPIKRLTIVYYDVGVLRRDVIEAHEIAGYQLLAMPSGGGTRVAGAMAEEAAQVGYRPHPTVVLTDGYDDYQLPPSVVDSLGAVVWCSYDSQINSNVGTAVLIEETTHE